MLQAALSLWSYRGFVLGSIKRELKTRHFNSLLGAVWTFLQPLLAFSVYIIVFFQVLQVHLPTTEHLGGISYGIYLWAGLLPWTLFSELTSGALRMFLNNANLLQKVNFPHWLLLINITGAALLNFILTSVLFALFLLAVGRLPGWPGIALLPVIALELLLAGSLGLILGILNVFFRDVGHAYTALLPFWFWMTPIAYPLAPSLKSWLAFNPLTSLFGAYQRILSEQQWPLWSELLYPLGVGIALSWLSIRLYRQHDGELADEL